MHDLPRLLRTHARDDRAGVKHAVGTARARLERYDSEERRVVALAARQRELHDAGVALVAGVDEVGRGALAGPVTAAAVILPVDVVIHGLDDSKRVPRPRRPVLAEQIRALCISCAVAHIDAARIDAIGIAGATREAMIEALGGLATCPDHVLVDGLPLELGFPSTAIVGGDGRVSAIAAASILAKVERDALMVEFADVYPEYAFGGHKGYGCAEHLEALRRFGPCAIHRMSFAPCAQDSLF
ncbi:MAG: ribonuclease HII [Coriobacteriia bacterium]